MSHHVPSEVPGEEPGDVPSESPLDPSALLIGGPADVVSFLAACGVPTGEPAQILLGLALAESEPLAHAVCGAAVRVGAGAVPPVGADELVALADELVVGAVVLATVVCGGAHVPTRHELGRFVELRRACADEGVVLLDWVVVTARHWWSMRERVIHEAA